jgi:choline-glycine betaine transporter
MKHLLLTLLIIHTVNAGEKAMQNTSVYLAIFFLILFIISIYAFYVNKCNHKNSLLHKKEKEIIELHQCNAEQEREYLTKKYEKEKEILSLNHIIADLERKLQEGTKNQVVAKIEALQKKRQNRQNHTSDS